MKTKVYNAIDLFSGAGGLTEGLHQAGFNTIIAVENDPYAVSTFKMNHKETIVLQDDIRNITHEDINPYMKGEPLHLLAGCPPCQGFSSIRRLNKKRSVRDKRNRLIVEYVRLVKELMPLTIMMENVPGLKDYTLFKKAIKDLTNLGYKIKSKVVDVKRYGVPQGRKRLVLLGSLLGEISISDGNDTKVTVRQAIGSLPEPKDSTDPLHQMVCVHEPKVMKRIQMTPHDGGSWKDLPQGYHLNCHKKEGVGFNDVYGRLRWDDYSATITGGCLNPSKGRFLHPDQDRAITPREASLLQSFPDDYQFPLNIPKASIALLIGNALPPNFSKIQALNLKKHIQDHLG